MLNQALRTFNWPRGPTQCHTNYIQTSAQLRILQVQNLSIIPFRAPVHPCQVLYEHSQMPDLF